MEMPFETVVDFLPYELRRSALSLRPEQKNRAEEIRLRAGRPLSIVVGSQEVVPNIETVIKPDDLQTTLEIACEHSVHTALDRMRSGFITVRGGHRIGICGEVITERGKIIGFRRPSSLNLRIAREVRGAAACLTGKLIDGERMANTLIIAPPGAGKTTLLRDLIRRISGGENGVAQRVGVLDERGELASVWNGMPQLDLGPQSDVLDGIPKAEGMMLLLRGMNPQILAVDEITSPNDISAIAQAVGCGAAVLATIHGITWQEVLKRPHFREFEGRGIFQKAVLAERKVTGERMWRVEEIIC